MPNKLDVQIDIERFIYAISGLLKDNIDGAFACLTLKSTLKEIGELHHCDEKQAAFIWMEQNFDALSSAAFAAKCLVEVLEP